MILLRSEDINLIKKLAISARIKGRTLAEPVADPRTGEIIANRVTQ